MYVCGVYIYIRVHLGRYYRRPFAHTLSRQDANRVNMYKDDIKTSCFVLFQPRRAVLNCPALCSRRNVNGKKNRPTDNTVRDDEYTTMKGAKGAVFE